MRACFIFCAKILYISNICCTFAPMKQLLADHIFSDHLRYEAHHLIYTPDGGEPIVLGGILGAALLCARLLNTEEQKERGFFLSEELHYEPFFVQYDSEVIADDWGYIHAELEQLDRAFIELLSDEHLFLETFCPNRRQLSIALDVVATYMHRIATEHYGEHIYEFVPWTPPFAQWLFSAAQAESQRQRFLQIDWNDPAQVHELACYMEKGEAEEPTFFFEGEEAADIMARYWDWLWNFAQKDAAIFPDSKVVMAEYKTGILQRETDYDYLKPEMKSFSPEAHNLFHKWMVQWTSFVQAKLQPAASKCPKKEEGQLFFPDNVLKCPTDDMQEKYAATREYIKARCQYDNKFKFFEKKSKFTEFCRQLTMLFGWYVDPNSLRKSMNRKPKRKTKKYV